MPIPKLKHSPSQPGKRTTAGQSISGETKAAAIRIRDMPSPLPLTLRPMQHHGQQVPKTLRKLRRDVLSFLLGRHEILPSGMNTCRPARSSDWCTGESMERKPCSLNKDIY